MMSNGNSFKGRHATVPLPIFILLLLTIIFIYNHPWIQNYHFVIDSSSSSSSSFSSNSTKNKLVEYCDVSKGEWIRDPEAPYYTNNTCWMIQEHQNCMSNGRPDMDFLKWRWKPDGCELPRFSPEMFLGLLRGKSLAFVGDSIARNQMQSLMCLLSKVEYPEDISNDIDVNFRRVFYKTYNFTISIFWSPYLVKSQEPSSQGGSAIDQIWKLYLNEADERWALKIDNFDYVIVSGGTWFTRPLLFYEQERISGCQYCEIENVQQMTLSYFHRMAFRTALQVINKLDKYKGMTIVRTISPQHFENGDWNKGGDCARSRPFGRNETELIEGYAEMYKNQLEEFEKARMEGMKRGLEFRLLDMTGAMLLRPDGHPSRYMSSSVADDPKPSETKDQRKDCVHWCLPGPVDMWNDMLLHMLSNAGN